MEEGSYDGVVRVPPTLPPGVAACEGISRSSWFSKRVILRISSGADVGIGLCQSVDSGFVPETGGRPLGDDHVAILIAQTLDEDEIPLNWMFTLRAWPI